MILIFSGGRMRSPFLAMKNLCIGCHDAFTGLASFSDNFLVEGHQGEPHRLNRLYTQPFQEFLIRGFGSAFQRSATSTRRRFCIGTSRPRTFF